nr:hypothetical protein [Tanacetum cinerariifolium]
VHRDHGRLATAAIAVASAVAKHCHRRLSSARARSGTLGPWRHEAQADRSWRRLDQPSADGNDRLAGCASGDMHVGSVCIYALWPSWHG